MVLARACVFVVVVACGSGPGVPAADLAAERFSARGRITAVHANELQIDHERIESIRTFEGKLEAMEPMTMVFSATTAAPIAGFNVGDLVSFQFTVHYKEPPTLRLVAIETISAGRPTGR